MGYINNFGHSIGPIKINNTWINNCIRKDSGNDPQNRNYVVFSQSKDFPTENMVPLMAATPVVGTYEDKYGKLHTNAPVNAIPTIEWVLAYASLKPEDKPGLDLNDYVKQDQLIEVKNNILSLEKRVSKNKEEIDKNKTIIIEINNRMSAAENNIVENRTLIEQNQNSINNIINNPFPNGVWFKCGGASFIRENE